jgi:Antibiotic biosynthesis monooxygenase
LPGVAAWITPRKRGRQTNEHPAGKMLEPGRAIDKLRRGAVDGIGGNMHARIVIYKMKSGTMEAVLKKAETGLLPIFQRQPGYRSYQVVGTGEDSVVSFSTWDTEAHCREAVKIAKKWVDENIGPDVASAVTHIGPVLFSKE